MGPIRTKVLRIDQEGEFQIAVFSDTPFYPGGGGQPCDTGRVFSDNFKGEVVQASKEGDAILHKIRPLEEKLSAGDEVTLEIDMERRLRLTKMHTGEHILFKSLQTYIKDLELVKIRLEEQESSLFARCPDLSWETLFKAEELANRIIREDRKIEHIHLTKQQAKEKEGLRIKIDRIKSDSINVVSIEDFDLSACAGTHLASTGKVKDLLIKGFSSSKGGYEIRFNVDCQEEIFDYARNARLAAEALETDPASVPEMIKKLLASEADYKQKFRDVLKSIPITLESESIGGINFRYRSFDSLDKKKLTDTITENMEEKTVICIINNEAEKSSVMLSAHPGLGLDVPVILKETIESFGGRGGGRDIFAQGSMPSGNELKFLESLREMLRLKG